MRLHVARVVEILQHRDVPRDAVGQLAPVPERVAAEERVLVDDLESVDSLLVVARGERAVQKQRQLLLQRSRRREHAVEPPGDVGAILFAAAPEVAAREAAEHGGPAGMGAFGSVIVTGTVSSPCFCGAPVASRVKSIPLRSL